MNYIKRSIELYKNNQLLSQIFLRIKTIYSHALSNQKKGFFDLMKVQGETENYFKIIHEDKKFFGIKLPLFELDNNDKLILPKNTKKIMIDVGTSVNWGNSVNFINENPNTGTVIGIEPNINSWLLGKGIHFFNKKDHIKSLPDYTKNFSNRIIFLPVALAPFEGFTKFNCNDKLGTSSILDSAFKTDNTTVVPTIKLAQIIKMIPDNFDYIDLLKIDAEGFDLQVLKSGEEHLSRVAVIAVECDNGHLFKNGYKPQEIKDFLKSKNFKSIPGSTEAGTESFINLKFEKELPNIRFKIQS
jgi:FkbM family methyltransferase